MNIARYSKAIMSVVGGVFLGGMAYAASKGYGTCAVDPETGAALTCTVLGFSTEQVIGFATLLGSTLGVGFGPKNAE